MNFKKSSLLLVAAWLIFLLGASNALASPVLIKLLLKDRSDYQKARAFNLHVYHRFDNLFIAELEQSQLKVLIDAGLSYEIIDQKPWTECYYVISESPGAEPVDLSEYGRVLLQIDDFQFLKISDQKARGLAEKGYYIAKVFRRAIPLKYKAPTEQVLKDYSYDPGVDSLLSFVSADSLYTWTLRMQDFQTRYSYSDSIHSARQWLLDKFISFGIDSVWFHHYYYNSDQYNVVATVMGTAHPDIVMVVGGHYDSVVYGSGTDPYVWAPGADDNASGTVATLEMARIIAQNPLPVTTIFVPFAQEEQGLIGSDRFAQYLYNQDTNLHLVLNADMIGHSVDADTDVTIYAAFDIGESVNIMMDMADIYTYLRAHYNGQSSGSDHYSFYQWGYDAIFVHEGEFFTNGWHKNYDIVDSLDFDYMKEVVKMELATLITVAKLLAPPYAIGDANGDEEVDIVDAVFLANYILKSGPAPDPLQRGDLNCDGETRIEDVVFLINYLFRNGPLPPAYC
ncbi:MAG: M20/M25/M40 family metallo-hydrolase [Candidatus Zixiibacteriota bacterium]